MSNNTLKSKEEVLDKHLTQLMIDNPKELRESYPEIKELPEYKVSIAAMDEYAEQEAIAFAEFVNAEKYDQHQKGRWHTANIDNKVLDEYSTKDIYQLFKQSQQKENNI